MADVSRRQFLRTATVGAAATGAVAVTGVGVFGALSTAATQSAGAAKLPTGPSAEGSDVFAHVTDAKTGEITVFYGEKAVKYTNHDLAQHLLRVVQ